MTNTPGREAIAEKVLEKLQREQYSPEMLRPLIITKWKDGIDLDFPSGFLVTIVGETLALLHATANGVAGDDENPEYNEKFQEGITYALRALAEIVSVNDWNIQDGSESVNGDTRATIDHILIKAGIIDDETGLLAAGLLKGADSGNAGLREDELRVIRLLLNVARSAYQAGDNSGYQTGEGHRHIDSKWWTPLEAAIVALDDLPDDPNSVCTPNAKADYALRRLLALPVSIPAGEIGRRYATRTDPLDELSRAVDARAYGGAEIVSLPSIPAPVVDREAVARVMVRTDPNYSIYHMPGDEQRYWYADSGAKRTTHPLEQNEAEKVRVRADAILALLPSDVTDRATQMEEILREQESRNHLRPAVTADAEPKNKP